MHRATTILFLLLASYFSASCQLIVTKYQDFIFYASVKNYIDYAVKDANSSSIVLKANYGTIEKDTFGRLFWHSCESKGALKLFAINKNTQKALDSIMIRVRWLPDPKLRTWGDLIGYGHFGVPELAMTRGIFAALTEIDYDFQCTVKSFVVNLIHGKDRTSVLNTGQKWSDQSLEVLKRFSNGDTVIINNGRVKCGCEPSERNVTDPRIFVRQNGKTIILR